VKAQPDLSGADFPLLASDDASPPPPQQLPARLTAAERFVGREAELTELAALLPAARTGKAAVISAISGTAGVGKTSLAVHWALQVAAEFPGGQLYVNLQGSGPSRAPMQPAEAVTGLLHALGATPEQTPGSPDEQLLLYRKLLAGASC
jgi:Mrp family chromosome partitioning ATPase